MELVLVLTAIIVAAGSTAATVRASVHSSPTSPELPAVRR